MYCQECGGLHKVRFLDEYEMYLCSNCVKMYREHPVNPLPPAGEIVYDEKLRPICHICGRAYNKLMSHARLKHDLTAIEYKKLFGLNTTQGIISPVTADVLRRHVDKNYETVVKGNLMTYGIDTRFENGSKGRTKEKLSLQALKELQSRSDNNKKGSDK